MTVPKLRFPEFKDKWNKHIFSDIFESLQNNTLSRSDLNYKNGLVKNVHYGDVLVKFGDFIDVSKEALPYITDNKKTEKYKNSFLQNGDIIFADTAEDETVGKCTEVRGVEDVQLLSGLHTIACRPKEKYGPKFLGYYLNSPAYHDQLKPLMQGIKVTSISKSALQDTKLIISNSFDEQKKIGSFLSEIDNFISLNEEKLIEFQNLKKSLLQKMFPKSGEVVPEIRFPGFDEEWELCKFSDYALTRRGLTYKPENKKEDGKRVLRSSNINEDTFELHYDDVFVEEKAVNIPYVKNGDILITAANGSSNLVGKHTIIKNVSENTTVHGGFMLLASTEEPEFLNASMSSCWYSNFVNAYVTGGNGAIGNLSKSLLDEQLFLIPSLEEQQKIGSFFKELDNRIELQKQKIDEIKEYKKGLLQQMFC